MGKKPETLRDAWVTFAGDGATPWRIVNKFLDEHGGSHLYRPVDAAGIERATSAVMESLILAKGTAYCRSTANEIARNVLESVDVPLAPELRPDALSVLGEFSASDVHHAMSRFAENHNGVMPNAIRVGPRHPAVGFMTVMGLNVRIDPGVKNKDFILSLEEWHVGN